MRVNFWCGRQVLEGFYNVDAVLHPKAPRQPELLHIVEFDAAGGIDFLVVFSTNAYPLEPTPMKYGKFRAYSTLYHGGDSSACQSAAAWLVTTGLPRSLASI
mgnify:CR=1 FL=1